MNRIKISGKRVPYTSFQRKKVSEIVEDDDFYEQEWVVHYYDNIMLCLNLVSHYHKLDAFDPYQISNQMQLDLEHRDWMLLMSHAQPLRSPKWISDVYQK